MTEPSTTNIPQSLRPSGGHAPAGGHTLVYSDAGVCLGKLPTQQLHGYRREALRSWGTYVAQCFAVFAALVRSTMEMATFSMVLLAGLLLWLTSTGDIDRQVLEMIWAQPRKFAGLLLTIAGMLTFLSVGLQFLVMADFRRLNRFADHIDGCVRQALSLQCSGPLQYLTEPAGYVTSRTEAAQQLGSEG